MTTRRLSLLIATFLIATCSVVVSPVKAYTDEQVNSTQDYSYVNYGYSDPAVEAAPDYSYSNPDTSYTDYAYESNMNVDSGVSQATPPMDIADYMNKADDITGFGGRPYAVNYGNPLGNKSLRETLIWLGNGEGRGYNPDNAQALLDLFTYVPQAKQLSGEQLYQALGAANYERAVGFINDDQASYNYSFAWHVNDILDNKGQ